MYLEKAKEILEKEYRQRRAENTSGFLIEVMDEKICHSYQVLGAGKYLLQNEECFANCSDAEKDFFQSIVLLHDLGRFYEFLVAGQGIKIDHGVYGSEMLAKIPEFNKTEAILAVKHHGHLIDKLYEDEEYQKLSENEKEKVRRIAFLVRDADKMANLYLLVSRFEEMAPMFFSERHFGNNPNFRQISAEAWDDFINYRSVELKKVTTFAERGLAYLSWVFDLNYRYSFVFLQKTRIVERMTEKFSRYCEKDDLKKCRKYMEEYIKQKIQ